MTIKEKHKIYMREYRKNNPEKEKAAQQRYRASGKKPVPSPEKRKEYKQRFYSTIRGYLHNLFSNIQRRCHTPGFGSFESYGGRGIKCKFKSGKEFANYIISILQIDPRGLQIHRINNNGHYEPGNIEFLTQKEHELKHKR